MTQTKFFLMMYGGLFLTVLVFSLIAFYIITRPNFRAHGADSDAAEKGADSKSDPPKASSPSGDAEA